MSELTVCGQVCARGIPGEKGERDTNEGLVEPVTRETVIREGVFRGMPGCKDLEDVAQLARINVRNDEKIACKLHNLRDVH